MKKDIKVKVVLSEGYEERFTKAASKWPREGLSSRRR